MRLPEQTVQAFAQTGDGFKWIGTTGGLLRFDGAHFTVFDRQNTPALRENSVFCLMVAKDGTLWAGTEGGGVVSFAQGKFRSWPGIEGQQSDFVRVIKQDQDGTIWAVGTDGGFASLGGRSFFSRGRYGDDSRFGTFTPSIATRPVVYGSVVRG